MKVYKIRGDFKQRYSWTIPCFKGYVVHFEDELNTIRGYAIELYDCDSCDDIMYIFGSYDVETHELEFFKLSNEIELDTLLFVFPDKDKNGVWGTFTWEFNFYTIGGEAKITIEQTDEKSEDEILGIFDELNHDIKTHEMLLFYGEDTNTFVHMAMPDLFTEYFRE